MCVRSRALRLTTLHPRVGRIEGVDRSTSVWSGGSEATGISRPADDCCCNLLHCDLAHHSAGGAFGLAEYPKRRRIEFDAGESQVFDASLDLDTVDRFLEIGERAIDALQRVRCKWLEVDNGVVGQ